MLLARDVIRFTGQGLGSKGLKAKFGIGRGDDARILWVQDGRVWLINLKAPKLSLSSMRMVDLDAMFEAGSVVLLKDHDYDLAPIDGVITEGQKARRDKRMATIKPLLAQVPEIFDSAHRGHAVARIAGMPGQPCATTIHETLRRYWAHGMTPNAILPRFDRIGRRGADFEPGETRLGRRPKEGQPRGINITRAIKAEFEKTTHRHYRSNAKRSLKSVWKEVVGDLATTRSIDRTSGAIVEVVDETQLVERAPTYRQFRYWYHNSGRFLSDKESRLGRAKYQKDHRAILGSATAGLFGIGSRFEVDATLLDVACVSERDRRRFVGRPTLHLVTDVYSKMIVGFYLGFMNSSWDVACLALRNVMEDKKAFCARFGIEIEESDWPCAGYLPARILGDRGEYEGYRATDFAAKTGVTIEVTAPYRGDMKGTIEKRFHMIHQLITPIVPGSVTKDHAEKGESDYRKKAKLNLRELTQIVIHTILYLNNKHALANHHRRAPMIDQGVPPIPREMWDWAMKSGRTELRRASNDRAAFLTLPVDRATVTGRGLKFRNIQYESETVRSNRWAELARAGKRKERPTISYHPNSTDQIYLHLEDGNYEVCSISPVSDRFAGTTFEEAKSINDMEKAEISRLQAKDIGGLRELKRVTDRIMIMPKAELGVELDNDAIKGGRAARDDERNAEEEAERPDIEQAWDLPEAEHGTADFGQGFAAFRANPFDEPALDLGDDDEA